MVDQNLVYQSRLHWIIFLGPVFLLIFAMVIGLSFDIFYHPSIIFCIVALVWFIITWVTYQYSLFIINKKQVIIRTGFLVRITKDIPLDKIESIDIRQSLLGSIFQYGSLLITGTGGSRQVINFLNKPLTCRRYIEQLLNNQN